MRRVRAAVAWWEDFAAPVIDPVERAMHWMQAKWWRMVAVGAIEAAVIVVIWWLT